MTRHSLRPSTRVRNFALCYGRLGILSSFASNLHTHSTLHRYGACWMGVERADAGGARNEWVRSASARVAFLLLVSSLIRISMTLLYKIFRVDLTPGNVSPDL